MTQLVLRARLILRQIHQHRPLADLKRMTAHAVVFLYDPPTILDVLTSRILWIIEERLRHVRAFGANTAKEKRRQRGAPLLGQKRLGHTQTVFRIFLLALIVDFGLCQFVFEEAFVAVPLLFFSLWMQVEWIVALLRLFREQGKIQTLYGRRALNG